MRNGWKFYLSLALVLAFLLTFLVYPLVYIFRDSVWIERDGKSEWSLIFFSLFLKSPFMLKCLFNSLVIGVATTILCLFISLPLAHLFCRYDFRGKLFWQSLLMAPLILPPFVGAIGVQHFFARFGVLNHLLGWVGGDASSAHPVDWIGSSGLWGVILMQSLHLFPILFFNISAAFSNLNPSMEEAALSLGVPTKRVFKTITFPLMMPGIFSGAVIVFVWAFTDLGTPLIFGLHKVMAVQIFDKVNETGFNPFGYTMVILVLVITLAMFLISRRLLLKQDYVTQTRGDIHVELKTLEGWRRKAVYGGLALFGFINLVPHMMVVLQSVSGKWMMSAFPESLTLKPYLEVILLPQSAQGLMNSFVFSICSAFLDVVLGVLIAYWLARRDFVGKTVLDALTVLPLALPGIVLAFGYMVAFNFPDQWNGWDLHLLKEYVNPRNNPVILLILSYSVRRLPFIVRTSYAGFQQISVAMEEASQNLGANQWMTARRIIFPLLKGNLMAGGILAFAFAFLEVSDSLILATKEKFYPVTKAIYSLLGRIEPGASTVACALGVIGMVLLGYSLYFAARRLGKKLGNLFG